LAFAGTSQKSSTPQQAIPPPRSAAPLPWRQATPPLSRPVAPPTRLPVEWGRMRDERVNQRIRFEWSPYFHGWDFSPTQKFQKIQKFRAVKYFCGQMTWPTKITYFCEHDDVAHENKLFLWVFLSTKKFKKSEWVNIFVGR
jgi:hypothetical protein